MNDSATLERDAVSAAQRPSIIRVADQDNVAIALRPIAAGERVAIDGQAVVARQDVPPGHKIALTSLQPDEQIIKYGLPIGLATAAIAAGDWVHSHNLRTALSGLLDYRYAPVAPPTRPSAGVTMPTFMGYRRRDGRVGTRNELWVLNTVGCVNHAAERIAKQAAERYAGRVDGPVQRIIATISLRSDGTPRLMRNTLRMDRFRDQINVVQAHCGSSGTTVLFAGSPEPKRLEAPGC